MLMVTNDYPVIIASWELKNIAKSYNVKAPGITDYITVTTRMKCWTYLPIFNPKTYIMWLINHKFDPIFITDFPDYWNRFPFRILALIYFETKQNLFISMNYVSNYVSTIL